MLASYPGSWWAERKRAWYLLFMHARNYPLLHEHVFRQKWEGNACTYQCDWYCDVQFSKYTEYSSVQRRAKQPHYSLKYTAITPYKFLLTFSLWQTATQWYYTLLPGSSRINTYFSKQKPQIVATCTFLRPTSKIPTRRRELEGAGEQMIETLPALIRKCADNVVVSVRYVVTVGRI